MESGIIGIDLEMNLLIIWLESKINSSHIGQHPDPSLRLEFRA